MSCALGGRFPDEAYCPRSASWSIKRQRRDSFVSLCDLWCSIATRAAPLARGYRTRPVRGEFLDPSAVKRLVYLRGERLAKSKRHNQHDSRGRYQIDAGSLK